jgi:RimJ/RimL family protein N-acetyltransferase
MIIETERLNIRTLKEIDRDAFFDMMSNPNVMSPIPRPVMDRTKSDANFEKHLKAPSSSNTKVMAIELIDRNTFIGIAAYLKTIITKMKLATV